MSNVVSFEAMRRLRSKLPDGAAAEPLDVTALIVAATEALDARTEEVQALHEYIAGLHSHINRSQSRRLGWLWWLALGILVGYLVG